ncbi:MAG: MFS transporter [Pseudomonadota bacterium]
MSDRARRHRWWILGAMGSAMGLVLLDETVVGVALPTIARDLGLSQTAGHWVINAYLLVFTGLAAAAGKLGDIFDIRDLYLVGLALFGGASLACGFAQSEAWIIAFRALQGVGGALIFPLSIAIIPKVFEPQERSLAYGINTAFGSVFLALGPFAGGFFTEVLSWRWIFWINLPVLAVNFLIMSFLWERAARRGERQAASGPFDLAGLFALLIAMGAIVLAVMQGEDWGWSSFATLGSFALGLVAAAAFIVIEQRRANPLFHLTLFENATFSAVNLVSFFGQFVKLTAVVFGAFYLQERLGISPLLAGALLLAGIAPSLPVALLVGRLDRRLGLRRTILIGLSVTAVGQTGLVGGVLLDLPALFVAGLVLWGSSVPLHFVPPRRAVMNIVRPDQQGQTGGINLTAQLLGGTVAIAVMSALYAATQDYALLFAVSGFLGLATLLLCLRFVSDAAVGDG